MKAPLPENTPVQGTFVLPTGVFKGYPVSNYI
jgi:hypothetical protein